MKRVLFTIVVLFCLVHERSQTYKALFIGNSYTYSNNLPSLVACLATANGDTLIYDSNTPGGYTFQAHSTNQSTISKINSQQWDYVILQEQSQKPSFSPAQVANEVLPYAAALDSLIKANNVCSETVFFMTWGRKYGDPINCQYYPPVCTYLGMQARLRESYLLMGQHNNSSVAPVGMAWKKSIQTDSTFNLYSADNSHPNLQGSYLSACVFYATMFGESPVGLNYYGSLNAGDALYLQNIAHSTVFDSLFLWTGSGDIPYAGFNHNVSGDTAFFADNSVNALTHLWNFGDANTSTQQNPVHKYNNPGQYIVTHLVTSNCKSHIVKDTVNITITGLKSGMSNNVDVILYPNPAKDRLSVKIRGLQGEITLTVFSIDGKELSVLNFYYSGKNDHIELSLKNFNKGIYIIKIFNMEFVTTRKLVIY